MDYTSDKWRSLAKSVVDETGIALQTVYDSLNKGQRSKLLKDESIKELFDRYGVIYEV